MDLLVENGIIKLSVLINTFKVGAMMFNIKKVGEQIALLRKEKGLTQDKLAENLSVSPQAVSKWENGHVLPETSLLPLLAKQLQVP